MIFVIRRAEMMLRLFRIETVIMPVVPDGDGHAAGEIHHPLPGEHFALQVVGVIMPDGRIAPLGGENRDVLPGGCVFIDSELVSGRITREDIKQFLIPATKIASDMNIPKLANMLMLGKLLKEMGIASLDTVKKSVEKCVPASKAQLLETNITAIETGYNY